MDQLQRRLDVLHCSDRTQLAYTVDGVERRLELSAASYAADTAICKLMPVKIHRDVLQDIQRGLAGYAWTYVHLIHGVLTYYLLHWHKGSPIDMDQGKYDKLTFWEQLDDGVQNTTNRKFFTAVPVVLFLLATHGSDYRKQPLGVNLVVVLVLVIAKFSGMHKVRLFGIGEVKYSA